VDRNAVLGLFDRQIRQGLSGEPRRPPSALDRALVRAVGSDRSWTTIVWSDLDEQTVDAAIADQVARFAPLGRDFEWKLYTHDRPADLGARLVAVGFRPEPEEALLVADAAELPTEIALPAGVRLLPVTDAAGVRRVVEAHEAAFATEHSSLERRLLTQLAEEPEAMAAVVAMAGDVPICAGRVEFHRGSQFASLWGGGTAPAWRGQGVYRALVAWRARLAAERGYRYLHRRFARERADPGPARLRSSRHDRALSLRAIGNDLPSRKGRRPGSTTDTGLLFLCDQAIYLPHRSDRPRLVRPRGLWLDLRVILLTSALRFASEASPEKPTRACTIANGRLGLLAVDTATLFGSDTAIEDGAGVAAVRLLRLTDLLRRAVQHKLLSVVQRGALRGSARSGAEEHQAACEKHSTDCVSRVENRRIDLRFH
jgi:GNAT superfamily N-acetyltransferase